MLLVEARPLFGATRSTSNDMDQVNGGSTGRRSIQPPQQRGTCVVDPELEAGSPGLKNVVRCCHLGGLVETSTDTAEKGIQDIEAYGMADINSVGWHTLGWI